MPDTARTAQVRLSLRSALTIVVAIAATILLLEIVLDAERVIAWTLTAIAVAALVHPVVSGLSRYVPRAIAVLLVVVLVLGSIGYATYRIVDDVSAQTERLQQLAPRRAAELERDSELLQEIRLTRRVRNLVNAIPERLRGGSTAEALQSAANRGLALVVGFVLTLFFVLYGPRLVDGALEQVRDPGRRRRLDVVVRSSSRRALGYARAKVAEVVVEGLLAYLIARLAGVPGPAALAVWVALWTLLPVAGLVVGALPIVVFAAADSATHAILVGAAFVVIGIGDWVVSRRVERRTVRVGSFLTALAMFAGLELYGFMGALLLLLGVIFAVAIVQEVGPEELAEVLAAPPGGTDAPSDSGDARRGRRRARSQPRRISRRRE
jgi:predicted PurR-regulated permease PerM